MPDDDTRYAKLTGYLNLFRYQTILIRQIISNILSFHSQACNLKDCGAQGIVMR